MQKDKKVITQSTFFEKVCELFSLFANIATACAFIIALIQYCEYSQEQKIERTLQINHQYFESDIIQARTALTLNSKRIKHIQTIRGETKIPQHAEKLIATYLLNWAKKSEKEWFITYGYYAHVYNCIDKKLCNQEDISPLIKSDAYNFFELFMHYSCEYLSKKTDSKDKIFFEQVRNFYLNKKVDCNMI